MHKFLRRVYDWKIFCWLVFLGSEEVGLVMPVSLFYACLHGSEVDLPRILGMVWNCDGDMGFLLFWLIKLV